MLGIARRRGAAAAGGGPAPRLRSSRSGTTEHPFAADDVELLEALAAQIALSVSRLQADAERAAAVAAMAEANQRLQLLAEAGRVLSGDAGHRPSRSAQLAELVVPDARRLVLARRDRRAGPAARAGVGATGTRPGASEVAAYVRAMVARR